MAGVCSAPSNAWDSIAMPSSREGRRPYASKALCACLLEGGRVDGVMSVGASGLRLFTRNSIHSISFLSVLFHLLGWTDLPVKLQGQP